MKTTRPAPVPRIFLICVRHSIKGSMIAAVTKALPEGVLALCPYCIDEGNEIRRRMGESILATTFGGVGKSPPVEKTGGLAL